LRLPPSRFHVETEFAQFELTSPMVLVANGAGIIRPSLYVYPGISPDDGWLDLIAVTATDPRAIASVLARFASRSMQRSPHVLHARARRIRIEAEPRMPVQVDGDVIGSTPADLRVLPHRAQIIVPSSSEATS
jgi:diacylglycerol kinase (ATP)